jgi:hypothetical protein
MLRSPVWGPVLRGFRDEIDQLLTSGQAQRSRSPTLARESASSVLARAHLRLLAALGARSAQGHGTVSELAAAAKSPPYRQREIDEIQTPQPWEIRIGVR